MDSTTLPTLFEEVETRYRMRESGEERATPVKSDLLRRRILSIVQRLPAVSALAIEKNYDTDTLVRKDVQLSAADESARKRAVSVILKRAEQMDMTQRALARGANVRPPRQPVALGKATITDDMWLNEDGIEHYFRVREIVAIKIVSFARNSTSDVSKTWEVVAYLSISDNGVPRRVTLYKGTSYGCERYVNWFVRASGGLCRR